MAIARMVESAAHLVDHVFPEVPVRQEERRQSRFLRIRALTPLLEPFIERLLTAPELPFVDTRSECPLLIVTSTGRCNTLDYPENFSKEYDLNSDRYSRWLTALANIGVLVGLAILIFEIRQNNELTMAQIEQSRSESFLSWRQEEALSDHLAPLIAKVDLLFMEMYGESFIYGRRSIDPAERQEQTASILDKLEPIDLVRFLAYLERSYWDFENLYFQYERGLFSEKYWNERIVPAILANAPDWKAVNGGALPQGRKEFNAEVERLLSAK